MTNVFFLNKKKSIEIYLNIFKKKYKNKFSIPEIIARCKNSKIKFTKPVNYNNCRNHMEYIYSKKIKEFTYDEKEKIYNTVLKLYEIVKSYNYNRKNKIPFLKNWFF